MIPILDWRRFESDRTAFIAELGATIRETGFFLLSHHGIEKTLRADVFAKADAFFSQPDSEKAKLSILNTPHFRGWGRPGDESLDETQPQVDTKETFNIGLEMAHDDPRVVRGDPFCGVNVWPEIAGFRDTMLGYFDAALELGHALHRAFAIDLGLADDHFAASFTRPMAALRLLHYPPSTGAANEIGAGEHTDYGSITLLMTDGVAGLQVRPRDGDWMDVPHMPGAMIVNIGDCLMRWTNDIYVSTPHRVLPPKTRRRSVAFFYEANPDAVIAALPGTGEAKYPPILAADYLQSRLDATYAPKEPV